MAKTTETAATSANPLVDFFRKGRLANLAHLVEDQAADKTLSHFNAEAAKEFGALIAEKGFQKLVEEIFRTLDSALVGWDDQFNQATEQSKQATADCLRAIGERDTYRNMLADQIIK